MKNSVYFFIVTVFFLFISCAKTTEPGKDKFTVTGGFDINTGVYAGVYPGKAELLDYKNGVFYKRKIFVKDSGWEKYKNFNIENLEIRVKKERSARIVDKSAVDVYGFNFSEDMSRAAATARLGTSPNTTALVLNMKKEEMIYSPDFTGRKPGKKRAGPAMEKVWFNTKISRRGYYAVCDVYEADGKKKAAFIFFREKPVKYTETEGTAMFPLPMGESTYFLRPKEDRKDTELVVVKASAEGLKKTGRRGVKGAIKGRVAGMERIGESAVILTGEGIYIYSGNEEEGVSRYCDFSRFREEFEIFEPFEIFTVNAEKAGYIIFAAKRYDGKAYSYKLYAKKF